MSRPDKLTPENILDHIESVKHESNGNGAAEFESMYRDRTKTKLDMAHTFNRGRTTMCRWIDMYEMRLRANKNQTV